MPGKRKSTPIRRPKISKPVRAPQGATSQTVSPPPQAQVGLEKFIYLLVAWLVLMAGLLALPNYNLLLRSENPFLLNVIQNFPADNFFARLPAKWFVWAGFLALIPLFRMVPPIAEAEWDLPPRIARICFWFFMALGAYLRLENPHQPVGFFWDDHYTITSDIRRMLDFHQFYFLFPIGWREPLFPYLSALLWVLFPHGTGWIIVLMADVIIDMAALWLFYLIGKEIGGRRMGVLLLALGSICKTMVMVTKFEYGNDTAVLASAASALFFLRLLKKPDLKHFLEWGAALGFGALAYVPYRPWMPVFLGAAWLWVFSDPRERKFTPYRLILGPFLLVAWAFLFTYKNSFLPDKSSWVHFFAGPGAILAGLAVAGSWVKVFLEEQKKGHSKLFGWATGALLTAILMAPFYLHPHYSEHVADISAFSPKFTEAGQGWAKVWENTIFTVKLLFGQVDHVSRMPAIGDSLYEFGVTACALLGVAYFIARPRWISAFFVSLFFVSTVAGTLSNGPHSFRYVICDLPLLLTGAWGINRLWLAFLQARAGKTLNGMMLAALLLGFTWETAQNHKLVWGWMSQQAMNTIVWDEAQKELPNHRVYLIPHDPGFYATKALDILADAGELFEASATNSIDLTPAEKGKDLAIFVWGQDTEGQRKVEKEFPGVQWQKRMYYLQNGQGIPYLWWTEVPFARVPADEEAFIHTRSVSPWSWRRRCYGYYGLGRGVILYEDRVNHWNDNLPAHQFIDWNNSMRLEGDWSIPVSGDYTLKLNTGNVLWLFLDGKKVLEVKPNENPKPKSYKASLQAGTHHVEMVTGFAYEHQVPRITVTGPGINGEVSLDQLNPGMAVAPAPAAVSGAK